MEQASAAKGQLRACCAGRDGPRGVARQRGGVETAGDDRRRRKLRVRVNGPDAAEGVTAYVTECPAFTRASFIQPPMASITCLGQFTTIIKVRNNCRPLPHSNCSLSHQLQVASPAVRCARLRDARVRVPVPCTLYPARARCDSLALRGRVGVGSPWPVGSQLLHEAERAPRCHALRPPNPRPGVGLTPLTLPRKPCSLLP